MKIKMCREIDEAGRIVIPADLRRQYGLKGGSKVLFTAYDDGILIHSEDYITASKYERARILSDVVVCAVLKLEADAIGVTLEEYVDKFLEVFYEEPQKLYSVI
ncbi:MAG: AbrB/MazE/SpoVT family DNA-binding domain-containing protein [Clostridia bacterium]|nr:AbrB/MazE/SpoVT family DNA-binding domain-containing protein [Clostridia bacterium]